MVLKDKISKHLEIYVYCSMNKQYVEGVQKWKKSLLDEGKQ